MFGGNSAVVDRMLARFAQAGAVRVTDIGQRAKTPGNSPRALTAEGRGPCGRGGAAGRPGSEPRAILDPADITPLVAEWRRVEAALRPEPIA